MVKQDRPSTSAPHSDTRNGYEILGANRRARWLDGIDAVAAMEQERQERRQLERLRQVAPADPAIGRKLDALASTLAEIQPTAIFVSRPAAAPTSTTATPVTISNVTHNHIFVAVKPECDRTHVDDVMEDDEVYVDWSKKGPKN